MVWSKWVYRVIYPELLCNCDVNEHYNIHDINRMDKKQLYTVLSRTTKFEYIHIHNRELNNIYFNWGTQILELTNAKFNSLYSNGKIYRVVFSDKQVYEGQLAKN